MKSKYKKLIKYLGGIVIVIIIFFSSVKINTWIEWRMAVEAAGSMPYQIGLTNVNLIQCTPSCCTPTCTCCIGLPGELCATKDALTCSSYQEAQGTPAGGMGGNALFSIESIGLAGLKMGGQLIAGSMSPALMDSGVLVSAGGCSGCVAKSGFLEGVKEKFKFVIAVFKD